MYQVSSIRNKQGGQALIILLLIMLVTLTIGLAVTQRSLSDLSSSNKVDQSTRAFSAAEAGIEKALQTGNDTTVTETDLQNQASATVRSSGLLPLIGTGGASGQALEYPPIGKDTVAQFWLADPRDLTCSKTGTICYPASVSGNTQSVDIYWGQSDYQNLQDLDIPAIEIDLITKAGSNYVSHKNFPFGGFIDPVSSRQASNGFTFPSCPGNVGPINTSNSPDNAVRDRTFRCKDQVTMPIGETPIMIRARILYSNTSQPIAVVPQKGNSLPQQAIIYTSVGTAGQSQRKIQVFKMQYVVPAYFDFAIFSAGDINKHN